MAERNRSFARRPEAVLARKGGKVELLRLPALLFGWVAGVRGSLYDRGWLWSGRLDVPVVSVGNLSAGGTGKTPMVLWLVTELERRGLRTGILSRGYKSRGAEANDEGAMIAELAGDVPHVQDKDRVRGGRELVRQGVEVIVLDDGFQHRRLRRDLDLVLIDATRPWGLPSPDDGSSPVRALIPRGLLREAPERLSRAHAMILTRTDQLGEQALEALREELRYLAPGIPILEAEHRPSLLIDAQGERRMPSALRGATVDLVSGIGNPEAFESTVRGLGATVRSHRTFPDHHDFRAEDLAGLGSFLTTSKDAPKLRALGIDCDVLEVRFQFVRGAGVLEALLDALPPGKARRERRNLHEGLHG